MVIVDIIIGRDCLPVLKITSRFSPNPSRTTAYWSIFLEVYLMPLSNADLSLIINVITMPAIIAITGPPIIGNFLPNSQEGTAMHRHASMPFQFFLIKSMLILHYIYILV